MIGGPILGGNSADRRLTIEGQSNAVGYNASRNDLTSELLTRYNTQFDRVYIYNPTSQAYEKLRMGVNNLGNAADQFGPEFGLAVRWTDTTVRGILFLEKRASNGQAIAYFQKGQPHYTAAIADKALQDAWLAARGLRPRRSGWLWVQGEYDAGASQATYRTALDKLISDRVADGLLSAAEKRVLMQMRVGTQYYGAGVAAAKDAYAAENPGPTRTLTMPPLFHADNLHLTGMGQVQMATDTHAALFNK